MDRFVWAALLLAFAALVGSSCSPLQRLESQQLVGLSDGQIKALDAAGMAPFVCALVGGPAIAGAVVVVVVPKSSTGTIEFTPDCHPKGSIALSGVKVAP